MNKRRKWTHQREECLSSTCSERGRREVSHSKEGYRVEVGIEKFWGFYGQHKFSRGRGSRCRQNRDNWREVPDGSSMA